MFGKNIGWLLLIFVLNDVLGENIHVAFIQVQAAERKLQQSIKLFSSSAKSASKLFSWRKHAKIAGSWLKFGSMNEPNGAATARFFQPNDVLLQGTNRIIDINAANMQEFSKQKFFQNIIDIPSKQGYVRIALDEQLLQKFFWRKHKKSKKLSKKQLKQITNLLSTNKRHVNIQKLRELFVYSKVDRENEGLFKSVINIALSSYPDKSVTLSNTKNSTDHCGTKLSVLFNVNGQPFWKLLLKRSVMIKLHWWPRIADEWAIRSRKWPKTNIIENLTKASYIISKSPKDGGDDTELKYNFIKVEELLTGMRSQSQHLNFYILKSIFYQWLKPIDSKHLFSYLVKTVMLWICEQFPPAHTIWEVSGINSNNNSNNNTNNSNNNNYKKNFLAIEKMLRHLLNSFRKNHLSNYFLPQVNLLKHVNMTTRQNVITQLKAILQNLDYYLPNNTKQVKSSIEEVDGVFQELQKFAVNISSMEGFLGTLSRYPNIMNRIIMKNVNKAINRKKNGVNVYWKLAVALLICAVAFYSLFSKFTMGV